ncbi:uncharacterized protein LOC133847765 [Drosophila sulfurigaster albostrigata]|uniref:uncharacterized protein LOC133847765 n=1 Tax=Drosophila sulfurigaster albostrigata TaxID=89887 RepID=UPI002D21D994|nr:uncharacterized protein LOC133847765 [Drosophila sulfurigaster albostrigata]
MRAVQDLWLSNIFDSRMVLQNHNTVVARSTLTPNSSSQNFGSHHGGQSLGVGRTPLRSGPSNQRPIVDLLVAMVAVPVLILCALQLEKNLHEMHDSAESRWLVFALGIGMLVISVIICGYVTHRMGVCIWAGPIDEAGNRAGNGALPHINSQNDVLRIVDSLPPSYESVVKCDLPPPPYDCLVIDVEQSKAMQPQTSSKDASQAQTASGSISIAISGATLHI